MKTALNKENAPELLGQLIRVLRNNEMEDALSAINNCDLSKRINEEWMSDTEGRKKRKWDKRRQKKRRRASALNVASRFLQKNGRR